MGKARHWQVAWHDGILGDVEEHSCHIAQVNLGSVGHLRLVGGAETEAMVHCRCYLEGMVRCLLEANHAVGYRQRYGDGPYSALRRELRLIEGEELRAVRPLLEAEGDCNWEKHWHLRLNQNGGVTRRDVAVQEVESSMDVGYHLEVVDGGKEVDRPRGLYCQRRVGGVGGEAPERLHQSASRPLVACSEL